MKNKNDFQIYEKANVVLPHYPKRSDLFHIMPIAVGTDDVESFTGYLNRVAREHCVSAGQLMSFCFYKSKGFWKKRAIYYSRGLNGMNRYAELAVEVLSETMAIDEIRFTNLLPLQHIISKNNLLREKRFWCPVCLNDDIEQNGIAYERLIWNLELVRVCSIHQTRLFSECPYCLKTSSYTYPIVYGYCQFCKNWLGDSLKTDTAYQNEDHITLTATWVEKEIRSLLKLLPVAEKNFDTEKLLDALFYLVMSQTKGNLTAFYEKFKIREYDFASLFVKEKTIPLRKMITICRQLDISFMELLEGRIPLNISSLNWLEGQCLEGKIPREVLDESVTSLIAKINGPLERYSQMFIENNSYKSRKVSKEQIEKAKIVMNDLLNKEPIPFTEVCRIVNVRENILKRVLPVLSLKLKVKYIRNYSVKNDIM